MHRIGNITIWKPIPPKGYVALGCIAQSLTSEGGFCYYFMKPDLFRRRNGAFRNRLRLRSRTSGRRNSFGVLSIYWRIRFALVDRQRSHDVHFNLRKVFFPFSNNRIRSFFRSAFPAGPYLNLRFPLGLTVPARIQSIGPGQRRSETQEALSKRAYYKFLTERRNLLNERTFHQWVTTTVEFDYLWVHRDPVDGSSSGIWKPVVPSGYRSVGDAFQWRDRIQPESVYVFYVGNNDAASNAPFVEPNGFQLLLEESSRSKTLRIWQPVAPDGYVSLGCVATIDARPGLNSIWYVLKRRKAIIGFLVVQGRIW